MKILCWPSTTSADLRVGAYKRRASLMRRECKRRHSSPDGKRQGIIPGPPRRKSSATRVTTWTTPTTHRTVVYQFAIGRVSFVITNFLHRNKRRRYPRTRTSAAPRCASHPKDG